MVERAPITLPNLEDWEREFLEYQQDLEQRNKAPLPPEAQALLKGLSMDEAFANSSSGGQRGGGKKKKKSKPTPQDASSASDGATSGKGEAVASQQDGQDENQPGGDHGDEEGDDEAALLASLGPKGDFTASDPLMPPAGAEDHEADASLWGARLSESDKLGDTRTLDRLYDHRLVLVVREKSTGRWTLPWVQREGEERLRAAAQRSVASSVGEELEAWVMGEFPLSVWLHEYSPEEQEAKGCLGEKRLFFRAEALDGRIRLDRDSFSDYQWLTRDEVLGSGIL